jgi:hypothetical protein
MEVLKLILKEHPGECGLIDLRTGISGGLLEQRN